MSRGAPRCHYFRHGRFGQFVGLQRNEVTKATPDSGFGVSFVGGKEREI
jgi:hypothetical protein